jgi:hypothetical protein
MPNKISKERLDFVCFLRGGNRRSELFAQIADWEIQDRSESVPALESVVLLQCETAMGPSIS